MNPSFIDVYARNRGLSPADARQTFMQVVFLKNLALAEPRLIGGGALVFGFGNPRFSEDIDLTNVSNPKDLKPAIQKTAVELEGWFGNPVVVSTPAKGRTWKLVSKISRAESLRLHIDSQPFEALSRQPIVIEFPGIQAFVIQGLQLEELMAEKILAVAGRRYLGGRDLFDLWFHWLRSPDWKDQLSATLAFIKPKLKERQLSNADFYGALAKRLAPDASLERARTEWKRYLPDSFVNGSLLDDIVFRCRQLAEVIAP